MSIKNIVNQNNNINSKNVINKILLKSDKIYREYLRQGEEMVLG